MRATQHPNAQCIGLKVTGAPQCTMYFLREKQSLRFPAFYGGGGRRGGGSSSAWRPQRQTEHPSNRASELPHPALSQLRKLKAGNKAFHTAPSPRQCGANAINCARTDTHVSSPLPSAPESSRVRSARRGAFVSRGRSRQKGSDPEVPDGTAVRNLGLLSGLW